VRQNNGIRTALGCCIVQRSGIEVNPFFRQMWLISDIRVQTSAGSRSGTPVASTLVRSVRVDDFICGHNGTGVVREIDVESGVHLIRIIRGRVFLPA
jgi:hypothetical protein